LKRRVEQKPTMKERAANAFSKYHELREKVFERMDNPKTKIGIMLNLMLAKRAQKTEKTEEIKKGLDALGERIDGMPKNPTTEWG